MAVTEPKVEESEGCWSSYKLTVEPLSAILFFVIVMSGSPLQDLVMRQSCKQFHMDLENCTSDESVDEEVHRMSSTFTAVHIIIDTLPGCIMSLFTSPWSDTNGRKPVIIPALIGVTINQFSLAYFSTMPNLHPYWLWLCGVPLVLTGGVILPMLGSFCYLIDVTTVKTRVIRFAILFEAVLISQVVGNTVAPKLESMGFHVVFGVCGVLLVFLTLYVIFYLPESVHVQQETRKSLFRVDHLVNSYNTFFKRRPNHARSVVFGLTVLGALGILVSAGEPDVRYLTVIKRFGWTISDYSTFNTVTTILQAITTIGGVYVGVTVLKMSETSLIIIIQITIVLSSFFTALSTTPTMYYIASQLKCFYGCLTALVKGVQSQVIPDHELATVITFSQSAEAFMPQIGALVYGGFYNLVVGTCPFAVYILTMGLSLIGLIWFSVGTVMHHYAKKRNDGKLNGDLEQSKTKLEREERSTKEELNPSI